LEITAITKAYPAVITISADPVTQVNTYIAGQLVRLNIPFGYGMQQANGQTVKILGVSGSDFSVDMDSRNFDSFSVPVSGTKPASLGPAGSNNLSYSNLTNRIAFQSLNNEGN
jgi:hypothetical protein